jgi:cell division protein FtsL
MKKLLLLMAVLLASVVLQITSLPAFAADGISIMEKRAVLTALICTTFSVVLALPYIRVENRKNRQEIRRINRKIAENEAKQRHLLREMRSIRPNVAQSEILKKLPRR